MSATLSIDYLGYELSLGPASIKSTGVKKIKDRVQDLIYWTLLYEPLNGTQNLGRITPDLDQDYVSLIWRLRRYLYGDLSERAVRRYQRSDAPLRRFKGVMAAYPLIDDTDALGSLDGWLAHQVLLAVRRRSALLSAAGLGALPIPHGLPLDELLKLQTVSAATGQTIDYGCRAFAGLPGPSLAPPPCMGRVWWGRPTRTSIDCLLARPL